MFSSLLLTLFKGGEEPNEQEYRDDIDPMEWLDSYATISTMEQYFTVPLCSGTSVPLKENGDKIRVTEENFDEFRALALARRLSEFDEAVCDVSCLSSLVPYQSLAMSMFRLH